MRNIFSLSTPLFGCVCLSLVWSLPAHAQNSSPSNRATISPYRGTSSSSQKQPEEPSQEECRVKTPPSFRFSLKHREANGIGYNQGYSSLDGFFLFCSHDRWFPFFDVRAHLFDNGKPAANLGFGLRYLPDDINAIFGVNGFLDLKTTSHSSFEQAGFGVEILGRKWLMRANSYFPIFSHNHLYKVGFYKFQGNHALFRASREISFKGYDISCGRLLWESKLCNLSATLGGYQFFSDYSERASGGLFKLHTCLTPYLSFEGQASYDSLFKGILQVQAAISMPFGKRVTPKNSKLSCSQRVGLSRRIAEEVDRFEMIVSNPYYTTSPGRDPRNGESLHIVFVNNSSSSGDGTAEHPFNSLFDAQNESSSWDMIYVYGGNGSPKNMDHGVTLQDGQWLQSSSKNFLLQTIFGPCTVPSQTTISPSILNTQGDAITLSNDNIIRGFDLRASDSNIVGADITNATITYNRFKTSSLFDIQIDRASGTIIASNNTSEGDQGISLSTTGDTDIILANNTFSNSGAKNIAIIYPDRGSSTLTIENNTFSSSQEGSFIEIGGNCRVAISLERNTFSTQNGLSSCISILSSAHSNTSIFCEDNLFNSPSPGLHLESSLFATASWVVSTNVGHYTGDTISLFPFTFRTNDIATASLYLTGNFANSRGFLLENTSSSATFNTASLDLAPAGVENLNVGSFTIDGPIHYIPFSLPE